MTFCCSEPRPASLVTTRAPVRVICQPVAPMRAASIGNGTRSSLATSRCLVVLIASSLSKSAVTRENVWTRSQSHIGAETEFQQVSTRSFAAGIPFRGLQASAKVCSTSDRLSAGSVPGTYVVGSVWGTVVPPFTRAWA